MVISLPPTAFSPQVEETVRSLSHKGPVWCASLKSQVPPCLKKKKKGVDVIPDPATLEKF